MSPLAVSLGMDLSWRYAPGAAMGEFLAGLRKRRILALRCEGCGRRYLPPRPFCGECRRRPSGWVPVAHEGTLEAWTVVHQPMLDGRTGKARPSPYGMLVRPDGADTTINHLLVEPGPVRPAIGQRVHAVWGETLRGAVDDIEGFRAMSVRLRPFEPRDRDAVAAILTRHFGSPRIVSRGALRDGVQAPGFVAEEGGAPFGLAIYVDGGQEWELLAVARERPAECLGAALLDAVVHRAISAGAERLVATTTDDNEPALAFYARHGFEVVERRAGAIAGYRSQKPEIPETGVGGRPIRDEIVLSRALRAPARQTGAPGRTGPAGAPAPPGTAGPAGEALEGAIRVPFRYAAGGVSSRFLAALRDEGRILGARCPGCGCVVCPARSLCPRCGGATAGLVGVGPGGTLLCATEVPGRETFALVRLDGAGTSMMHHLLGSVEEVRPGARVRARFAAERAGTILDIAGFEPEGDS
ncbi:MAG: GNAT family N-acetyltransferase [Acidobacteria bacterium]|nr:GNAT family N-acetyltransferase [Acidobacteriota bacterium]